MTRLNTRLGAVTLLLTLGIALLGQGAYMQLKAGLAQWLIAQSWHQRADGSSPATPWWWADTRAVAVLRIPSLAEQLYVMEGASGEALAFGPGHMPGSSEPGKPGHSVVAGHRDSHFEFVQHLQAGQLLEATHFDGSRARYRVSAISVIDSRHEGIPLYADRDRLTLVTCYPFNRLAPRGPLRMLVSADAEINGPEPELETDDQTEPDKSAHPAIVDKGLKTPGTLASTN